MSWSGSASSVPLGRRGAAKFKTADPKVAVRTRTLVAEGESGAAIATHIRANDARFTPAEANHQAGVLRGGAIGRSGAAKIAAADPEGKLKPLVITTVDELAAHYEKNVPALTVEEARHHAGVLLGAKNSAEAHRKDGDDSLSDVWDAYQAKLLTLPSLRVGTLDFRFRPCLQCPECAEVRLRVSTCLEFTRLEIPLSLTVQ